MRWFRAHIAIVSVALLSALSYAHGDVYLAVDLLSSQVEECACCRTCLCENDVVPKSDSCQVRSSSCAHTNVQTLLTFMKNSGPLPMESSVIPIEKNALSTPLPSLIPVPVFGLGIFHPPRS
jgi:hypothetical protein